MLATRRRARVSFSSLDKTQDVTVSTASEELNIIETNPSNNKICCFVLQDKSARQMLDEEYTSLQTLVEEQYQTLQSMGSHASYAHNSSSLRSKLSERLEKSVEPWCEMQHHVESDMTVDMTEEEEEEDLLKEPSMHYYPELEGQFYFDFDEEQRALDRLEQQQQQQQQHDSGVADEHSIDDPAILTAELAKGNQSKRNYIVITDDCVTLPLHGASETWQGIRYNCTTATDCSSCQAKLHVVENAEYVVCMDCWMLGPVLEKLGDTVLESDNDSDKFGIGLGVKAEDLLQWVG